MSKFCVKKPFTVLVAVVLVIVLGFVSLTGMQTDLLPDFSLPYLVVVTTYPGASPEKVESAVTQPMERALGTINGVETVTSTSAENYSMIMLEFTEDMNMDSAMVKVSTALDTVKGTLPDLCGTPSMMEISMDMVATVYVGVSWENESGEQKDIYQLSDFTEQTVMPYLERQSGVASVKSVGVVDRMVEIRLDPDKVDEVNDRLLTQVSDRLAEAKVQMEDAQAQLDDAKAALEQGQEQASQGLAQASEAMAQLSGYQSQLTNQQAQLTALQTARAAVTDGLSGQGVSEGDLPGLILQTKAASGALQLLYDGLNKVGAEDSAPVGELTEEINEIIASLPLPDGVDFTLASLRDYGITNVGEIREKAEELSQAAEGLESAQTALEQFDSEITSLTVEIQVTQAIVDQFQSALNGAGYDQVVGGTISAAAGFGSGDAQLAMAQSQLDSAKEEYESARTEALSAANLDSLLNLDTLSKLIYAQNFAMPAGYLDDREDNQWLLKVGEQFDSVDEISGMLLCSMEGVGDVRISDVAQVTILDNAMDEYARMNGRDATVLAVFKGSTAGTSEVSKVCNQAFEELETKYPGLHLTVLNDQGDYIRLIVDSIFTNLVEGALLAILVLLLFLKSPKPTLVVAFSIPFSVLFAIVLMYFADISLNMISLSGLALGIGMLVDNSVVVVENIYRLRGRGLRPGRAAVQGANQVAGAIVASTLTTICVFVPLLFSSGLVRELMGDMGLTIAFALLASLVVALSVVPAMSVPMLKHYKPKPQRLFDRMLGGYEKALRFCLRVKAVPLVLAVALLAGSVFAVTRMGIVMLPDIGTEEIRAGITMPEDITQEDAYARADQVMDRILQIDGVKELGGLTTSTTAGLISTAGAETDFIHYSLYVITDKDADPDEVKNEMLARTEDLDCQVELMDSGSVDLNTLTGSGLTVNIYGDDLEELVSVSEDVMDMAAQIGGFTNISNGQEDGDPVAQLNIRKDEAMSKGLTVAQIYQELTAALTTESSAATVTVDGSDMQVNVVSDGEKPRLEELMDHVFTVTTKDETGADVKSEVTLSDIAELTYGTGMASISRENQTRTMTVTADTEEGSNTTLLSRQLEELLNDYTAPDGVSIKLGGETDSVQDMLVQMGKMIALAVLFVYLVMVAQFQSLLAPFIVLFTMPLAFTGGMIGLLVSGEELSMMSLVGFLVLVGVVVNNGIVFVDYANQLRLGGLERREALVATGRTRMRPILMTALTTIFAMTMMIFSKSAGSQMGRGMAIVVVGGLLYGTLMTLFIVPVMYDLLYRRRVVQVDVGEGDLGEIPDDAAEYMAEHPAAGAAEPADEKTKEE